MSSDSIFKTRWNDASESEASYSRLSVTALLSVCFGWGAWLVYFTPWFFFLGVIAILLSLVALWMIHRAEGTLTGTPLAYVGLCSAVVALVSIFLFWQTYQYGVRREADQFFRLWFAAVQQGDIPQAKEYQFFYMQRSNAANADEWWQAQYGEKHAHRAIHRFVENKLVRVLMALGEDAKVSYYKTLEYHSEPESDMISSIYAVTFPAESGETETFFVRIHGTRAYPANPDFKNAGWRIESTPAFYLPDEFKTESSK